MPGFDRTGPRGEGPRTGRNMGKCGPAPERKGGRTAADSREDDIRATDIRDEDFMERGWGSGRGRGRRPGGGRGRGGRMRGGW